MKKEKWINIETNIKPPKDSYVLVWVSYLDEEDNDLVDGWPELASYNYAGVWVKDDTEKMIEYAEGIKVTHWAEIDSPTKQQ